MRIIHHHFMKGLAHCTLKTSGEVHTFSYFNSCCYWKLSFYVEGHSVGDELAL